MLLIGSTFASAETLNLQFVEGSCNGTTYCAKVQIQSGGADAQIGNSTVFFSYNAAALTYVSTTALDFDVAQGYAYAPETGNLVQGALGEINYNIFLGNTSAAAPVQPGDNLGTAATTVTTAWMDVAEFCFDITDAAATADFMFSTNPQGDYYSGFNDETNDDTVHTLGLLADFNPSLTCTTTTGLTLQLKVFLEGPYNGGAMNTGLNTGGVIPASQPYNYAPYNYAGGEMVTIANFPTAVDWVIVQVSTDGTTAGVVYSEAAMLLSDGSIVDTDGTAGGVLTTLSGGTQYYYIVRHRNHLDVVSTGTSDDGVYDFTTTSQTAGTVVQQKDVGGVFAMQAGDLDGNLNVNTFDAITWVQQNAELNQYLNGDMDFNVNVNTFDILKWVGNNANLGVSAIAP